MAPERTTVITQNAEKIGVIGSPSSTSKLSIDLLRSSVAKKLIGELSLFRFSQNGKSHYAIGQITEVHLVNPKLEGADARSAIRDTGVLESVSGDGDIFRGVLTLSAVFGEEDGRYFPSLLGTVPPTGTPVHLVSDAVLEKILERYRKEIFQLGNVYGSTPRLPMWFKHFGSGANGAGEAYHLGIFGKTGSGKSVLAKMLLLAYARHPEMAVFVLDPQGEFAMDIRGEIKDSRFDLKISKILAANNKKVIVKNVSDLTLESWPLFTEILRESLFFQKIGIKKPEEKRIAAEDITRVLKNRYKTTELVSSDVFFHAFKSMGSESANPRFQRIFEEFSYSKEKYGELYETAWKPVCELFRSREGSVSVRQILNAAFFSKDEHRPIVVMNLSGSSAQGVYWNENIQSLVVQNFLESLKDVAELSFRKNQFLNTLVILDEAHRLAPREETEDVAQESVRQTLIDAVRTTRKFGLGWLFISQTLASLPKEIVEQMRILFFGFGLAFGKEFTALKELAGGDDDSLRLYQSFRDPHSAFDVSSKQYNFMSIGPVSPLSFSGTPLFFTAFNNPVTFLTINRLARISQKASKTAAGQTSQAE